MDVLVTSLGHCFIQLGQMLEYVAIKREDAHVGEFHQHTQGQLFIIHDGTFVFETALGRWIMPKLKAGWVPPNILHNAESFNAISISSIYVDETLCIDLPKAPCVFTPSTLLICLVETISTLPLSPWHARIQNLCNVLMDELRCMRSEPLHVPFPKDKKIAKIVKPYIDNPSIDSSLDALAKQVNLSRRSFTRHFKSVVGLSFGQWYSQVKIVKACEYLAQDISISETAFNLGFSQVSSFSALFKKYIGMTPKAYKQAKIDII